MPAKVKPEQAKVPITPIVKSVFPEYTNSDFARRKSIEIVVPKIPEHEASTSKAEKPKDNKACFLSNTSVKIGQEVYRVGDGVLMDPATFQFSDEPESEDEEEAVDENMRCQKRGKLVAKPFCIGRIIGFERGNKSKPIFAIVRMFYRPENTTLRKSEARSKDLNLVYFSNETKKVAVRDFLKRCVILPSREIQKLVTLEEYFSDGDNRFYYEEMFNGKSFEKPPRSDDESAAVARIKQRLSETSFRKIEERLRTMDLFCGCGGLTLGLHQSGLIETRWAVDNDHFAAEAFKLNNPEVEVFEDDINKLLQEVIDKDPKARLPDPATANVEVIIGGTPCQGFSDLSRANGDEPSKRMKNSLLISFLCAVELYEPKLVIMENVKNLGQLSKNKNRFERFKNCLQRLGYKVTDKVLNAGNYGVPQSRDRLLIVAVKNGWTLPEFPESTTSFENISGPFRSLTVGDAILDLADIECAEETKYKSEPMSHYQRIMRKSSTTLTDHVTRKLSDLNQERVNHVPRIRNADWRNIPNKAIPDLGIVKMTCLNEDYFCEDGAKCRAKPIEATLIPWFIPHKPSKKNRYAGLYGRLHYDSYFHTIVTKLDPSGMQGRFIHPFKNRLITFREAARGQGFPDDFKFCGGKIDRMRQTGNAVPPPLAKAIGQAILRQMNW